ncbi:A disintegrin and metalloproteinase with thrombospondin motifs 16 [Scaptodrosophila lebanonensis]|uniref:A disintegrin and metalloproteinase with thrombospondin motifs 16 n=1 Tax=Drosophila lebanonensis TaxID=7225 RepID=A0A6J2TXU6_DROLE|nr:A disintegrin and metalloproteinase with thrombospondin motifs 16 [Scaptodrosophila lebanonensis]
MNENSLLEHLEAHELALIFGTTNEPPEFKLVHLRRRAMEAKELEQEQEKGQRRWRRSTSPAHKGANAAFSDADGGEHLVELQLQQTPHLIDDAFIFIRRTANNTQFIEHSPQQLKRLERCFYRSSWAALDLCDPERVRGVFQQNASDFVIHPLPTRFGAAAHLLYEARKDKLGSVLIPLGSGVQFEPDAAEFNEPRRSSNVEAKSLAGFEKLQRLPLNLRYKPRHHHPYKHGDSRQLGKRPRRHISSGGRHWRAGPPHELHIETAIFVDSDLYRHMEKNFPKDTESQLIRFVLAMINGVQLLYHHPTLGRRINFVLKRLEIFRKDPPDLRRSSDIDQYLSNFCMWQKTLNPLSDADSLHYDHAVILTGLDLYVIDKNGKATSQVVGLAPVSGMCTVTSSCTINEGKHFESVFVVAHEIGHNLGMRHDTKEINCDPSLHIMSPTLGSGKNTWSECSRDYLEKFLEQPQAECLFDRGQFKEHLDHAAEGMLPGERFDANQQCMLKYGRSSVRASVQSKSEICHDLHCQRDRYTWTSHPALEGTECGDGMFCRGGYCVMRPTQQPPISALKQLSSLPKPSYDKANFVESSKMGQLLHEQSYNYNKANEITASATWSDWGEASACESGCLYGPSNRLREGSTGLRIYNRSCLNYRHRCMGRDRKFESCIAKKCYSVPVQTIADFATQVCKKTQKSDSELTGEGLQLVSSTEESCKVFCKTKTNGTKSRRWTFPDGTTCRSKHHASDDIAYCISGRCERFSCDNTTTNFFKMDSTFCQHRAPRPVHDSTEMESKLHNNYQNNVNYKRYAEGTDNGNSYQENRIALATTRSRYENEVALRSFHGQENYVQYPYKRKVSSYEPYRKYNYNVQPPEPPKTTPPPPFVSLKAYGDNSPTEWVVKSGCHSSCMAESKGLQVVSSRYTGTRNIQLCTHKVKPCERLTTAAEYAEQTCARYKLKVRGLSGHGAQISASIDEPDRSCRVGCQDEFIKYRYYLVNGPNGHFPLGTRCSQVDQRYCVNGKCLEFGDDNLPLQQSHISLALFRSRRDVEDGRHQHQHQSQRRRQKRSFLYYDPVNITETITQEFLNNIANSIIDFELKHLEGERPQLAAEHIEFTNPIHVSMND